MVKVDVVEIRETGGGKLLINKSKFDPTIHTLWKDHVEKVEIEKQEETKPEKIETELEAKTVDEVVDEIIKQEKQEEQEEEEISKPTRRKYTKRG